MEDGWILRLFIKKNRGYKDIILNVYFVYHSIPNPHYLGRKLNNHMLEKTK